MFCISISIFIISVRSQCGADLTTESGVITSPRFPSSYPDEANCEWKIAVDDGSRITLTFVMFEVQNSKLITRGEMALKRHETQQFISFLYIYFALFPISINGAPSADCRIPVYSPNHHLLNESFPSSLMFS